MEIKNTIFIKRLYFLEGGWQFKNFMYKAYRSPCFQSMGKFVLKRLLYRAIDLRTNPLETGCVVHSE